MVRYGYEYNLRGKKTTWRENIDAPNSRASAIKKIKITEGKYNKTSPKNIIVTRVLNLDRMRKKR